MAYERRHTTSKDLALYGEWNWLKQAIRMVITRVLAKLPTPCMEKTQTTVSPRRAESCLVASARSLADVEATGYSPPTPTPNKNCIAVNMANILLVLLPEDAVIRMPKMNMVPAVRMEPFLRPSLSAAKPIAS